MNKLDEIEEALSIITTDFCHGEQGRGISAEGIFEMALEAERKVKHLRGNCVVIEKEKLQGMKVDFEKSGLVHLLGNTSMTGTVEWIYGFNAAIDQLLTEKGEG